MRDSLGRRVFRWQVAVRLSDGTYRAPCRVAQTPKLAQVEVMRALHREGRSGFAVNEYRQVSIAGDALTEWCPFPRAQATNREDGTK